jgi:arylformamidase
MTDKVFRDYTQAELDHNYDQRVWAKNAPAIIARCAELSATARETLVCHRDLAYGTGADEILDWYPAAAADAPLLIWTHGGAWRNFTKNEFAFLAPTFVNAGVSVALLNFSKAPSVRVSHMVEQVRRAYDWVAAHAAQYGGSATRLFVGGHSSGAHLTATALIDLALPLRAAFCVSGSYDLEAVMLSARADYLTMEGTEEHDLSPARHTHRCATPVLVVYTDGDTHEFQRHSREYAEALAGHGRLIDCVKLAGMNHFEINASLADARSPLSRLILDELFSRA